MRNALRSAPPLLDVRGLSVSAEGPTGPKTITSPIDLTVARGETVGIVGESGSGKSLATRSILRLQPPEISVRGEALFDGRNLLDMSENELRRIHGRRITMMLQDPFTMLNPLLRCGKHIEEGLPRLGRRERAAEVQRRLDEVGIVDPDVANRYPFQLSGGMCQRVALAAALARNPELLIADEPSTALDVTTQAEILALLADLQRQRGMGLILITHDLRLAFSTCDRVYVLYAGSILETGKALAIEKEPFHPYTLGLCLSEPPADRRLAKMATIRGSVATADQVAGSCKFAPRCDWAREHCWTGNPRLQRLADDRQTACIRFSEIRREMRSARSQAFNVEPAAVMQGQLTDGPLVRVDKLTKTYARRDGGRIQAVSGVTLEIARGESVGLVGESGSGKTTIGRCLIGLETPNGGAIEIDGITATLYDALRRHDRARLRRTIQIVFQDPYSTLNPRHSVRRGLLEALRVASDEGPRCADEAVLALLAEVGLPASYAGRRPATLSGGERQRIAIARALAVRPKILICDEPVSALDISVQAQILNLIKRLQVERCLSCLFITHDLAVLRQAADRVYVLHLGEIVEHGTTEDVMTRPVHPYTRRLISSIPGRSTAPDERGRAHEIECIDGG